MVIVVLLVLIVVVFSIVLSVLLKIFIPQPDPKSIIDSILTFNL